MYIYIYVVRQLRVNIFVIDRPNGMFHMKIENRTLFVVKLNFLVTNFFI